MSNIVDGKDKLSKDLFKMLLGGSSNDVKIVLEDGDILANKDVLSARCDYFAICFSKFKFTEGKTDTVDLSYCSKVIMEKIIHYLFSGRMELQDLSLSELIKMMNMASMLLLDELLTGTEKFVLGFLPDTGVNCGSLPDLVEGLILVDQFKLQSIKDALVLELHLSLMDVVHIPDVVQESEAFKHLPVNLLKDVLQGDLYEYVAIDSLPTEKEKVNASVYWLSENECDDQDKRKIKNLFDLDDFTEQELLADVKRSGLFSIQEIDNKVKARALSLESEVENIRRKAMTIDSSEKLSLCMEMVFAVDEPSRIVVFASVCREQWSKNVFNETGEEVNFRNFLFERCRQEFVKDYLREAKEKHMATMNATTDEDEKKKLKVEYRALERKLRISGLGIIRY